MNHYQKMKTTSMKTGKDLFQTSLALGLFKSGSLAQCPNNNNPYGNINNLNPGQTSTVFCMYGGEYVTGGYGIPIYQWSNGSNSNTANQLAPGKYNLVVTDEWQCAATANISLTEPTQLIADAGEDETVYYGYTPLSCADIGASAQGGCPEYSYSWSANESTISTNINKSVRPNVSTNYELRVTDENGCDATGNVEICVVD